MTAPEVPESWGSLFGGPTDDTSETVGRADAPAYPTRRSLRMAAAEHARSAPPAETAPPAVHEPAPVVAAQPAPIVEDDAEKRSRIRRSLVLGRRDGAPRAPRPLRPLPRPTVNRAAIRARFSAAGAMVVVGGIFASFAIPAFAEGSDPETVMPIASSTEIQSLAVSDEAAASAVDRDEYQATSAAALRRLYRDQVRQANLARYLSSDAVAQGDDYPWPGELTNDQGGGLSPLRYYYRECVDFVAWRLNRDVGSTRAPFMFDWSYMTPGGGSAISWKYQWDAKGWASSSTPSVGWVAWFGGQNHVAYVSEVNGSMITVEEYNWGNDHAYNKRTIPASSVTAFLSPPPLR